MHNTLNGSINNWLYGQVCKDILAGNDLAYKDVYENCVIFGVTSIPSRALHFSIMLEAGAQWARIPLHKIRWQKPTNNLVHDLNDLQCWDCHGWDFSITHFEYLRDMGCTFKNNKGEFVQAKYWFTLDHTDNAFSDYPPEHKCYHLLLLEDGSGQIAAMPNNRILWQDHSFVKKGLPIDYFRVMGADKYHAEETDDSPQETAFTKEI
jgi:hypothetical protein